MTLISSSVVDINQTGGDRTTQQNVCSLLAHLVYRLKNRGWLNKMISRIYEE